MSNQSLILFLTLGPKSYKVRKDFLIDQIQTWPTEWFVKFKLIVNTLDIGSAEVWYNVIHFTEGESNEQYGTRIPALFINKLKQKMAFFIDYKRSDGTYTHYYSELNEPIEIGREYHIQFRSEAIVHNGQNIHKVSASVEGGTVSNEFANNYYAEVFNNVKIYASNPWFDSLKDTIKDLEIGPLN